MSHFNKINIFSDYTDPFFVSVGSLALPSYVLPLNLDFTSVLGLAIRYVSQIFQVDFQLANQRTEELAENERWCASLCCSSVMAAEKDATKATFGPLWQRCRISIS